MNENECTTYLSICFDFDKQKNAEIIKEGRSFSLEEIGIFNKDEVEKYLANALEIESRFDRHHFIIGFNNKYNIDVNKMIRQTIKGLIGKEDKIKELKEKYNVSVVLEIVPYIDYDSDEPHQILSLDQDIIDFLSKSTIEMDLDYYVI